MLHLDNLKKLAKQIVRWHREGYYPVAQRIRAGLPRFCDLDDATILSKPFALSDAHELSHGNLDSRVGRFSGTRTLAQAHCAQTNTGVEMSPNYLGRILSCLCPTLKHLVTSSLQSSASRSASNMETLSFTLSFKGTALVSTSGTSRACPQ